MQQQKTKQPILLPTAIISLTLSCSPVLADYTQDIEDALNFYHYGNNGAVKADINYRWENVNQDKGPLIPGIKPPTYVDTANANTVRVRLGLLSPTLYDFQAYAEYQGLYALQDDYNQGVLVKNTNYSVIQDPQRNELDQLWLSYKGIDDTLVKFGGKSCFGQHI